jgi:hypothetical protein
MLSSIIKFLADRKKDMKFNLNVKRSFVEKIYNQIRLNDWAITKIKLKKINYFKKSHVTVF